MSPDTTPPTNTDSTPAATPPAEDDSWQPHTLFKADPAHQPAQQPQPQPQPTPQPLESPRKRRPLRAILLILAVVVGITMVIGYVYMQSLRVTVASLVTENIDNTSYLRPQKWKPIKSAPFTGYGNMRSKDGKPSAIVLVTKSSTYVASLTGDADESYYAQLRQGVLHQLTDDSLAVAIKSAATGCADTNIAVTKEADTASTPTTVGLLKINESCTGTKGKFILKTRWVAGKDGYLRMIAVGAFESQWKLNTAAFQKMLDSLAAQTNS